MVSFRPMEAERVEEIIDPERPIVDAHHHLWDYPGRRYLVPEFAADLATGHNIVATVHVEAVSMYTAGAPKHLQPVGETEFARGAAAMSASENYGPARMCSAIVGFVDLADHAHVQAAIDAHVEAAGGRFRGIRDGGTWDADESIRRGIWRAGKSRYLDPDFRKGFARLTANALTFDAWLYHPQLDELADLADAFPDTTIILDHVGGPLRQGRYRDRWDEELLGWRQAIARLAERPNIMVKLGGLGMWTGGLGFEDGDAPASEQVAATIAPYLEHCIACFGAERAMFESNFPADKPGYGYSVIWNAFKRFAKAYSDAEQDAMFFHNANRIYRLGL